LKTGVPLLIFLPAIFLLWTSAVRAQDLPDSYQLPPSSVRFQFPEDHEKKGGDLTLENLFTAGWCEEFQGRPNTGGAERIILFRTLAPFQDREVLGNYSFALNSRPNGINQNELGAEVLLPLNRRLMFDAELSYDFNGTGQPDSGAANGALTTALQLVDTACAAVSFQVSLNTPGRADLLDHRLFLGFGLAGFRDLGARFGLQGSLAFNLPLGSSHETGSDVALVYAVALTWTLTDNRPWFGYLTPFVELPGTTELGVQQRHTFITILPGVEWALFRDWWLAGGVEVPLTGPRPFDLGLHFSVIRSF
jgi:hypothetical protein